MYYVDTHCHVDQYPDIRSILQRAEEANVVTVAVTELPSGFQRLTLRLGKRKLVRVALGLHPLRAGAVTPMELALFSELLDQTDYIGEIGLDGSQSGRPTLPSQLKVFEHVLRQPRIKQKVLTVHSRGAEAQTIDCLGEAQVAAILHWYTGSLEDIERAITAGLWFSVNPAMLTSKSGQRVIEAFPRDRVVTETDGPYTKVGDRPTEPHDVRSVVAGLARVWGEDLESARQRVFGNMAAVAALARGARTSSVECHSKQDGTGGSPDPS